MLLALAWLLPLASFVLIVSLGPKMGRGGRGAGLLATAAILGSLALSLGALTCWLVEHPLAASHAGPVAALSGDWYTLAEFGSLRLTIGYYIDGLTVAMFCMVTLVASCIHVFSFGYMHEELHEVTDPLSRLSNGEPLRRRGRFHRFYQYLSLFCFSMLGLVIAGNLAMVFAFWELVGICSYLLIGFYFERRTASNAANKAFIVNRVGDFGMIIGLMAIWAGMGTFSFGNYTDDAGAGHPGIFSQVRPAEEVIELTAGRLGDGRGAGQATHVEHPPRVPDGMVMFAARTEAQKAVASDPVHGAFLWLAIHQQQEGNWPAWVYHDLGVEPPQATDYDQILHDHSALVVQQHVEAWRQQGYGYWLLVVAGLGIFCGCVGKSAQFPLHVWLPDAMEGPTPVSALIHAATMVAAGVYLVGRFYPVFTPEVLLVIAYVGCITLFIAATIAVTATDIKRVLAYSTVSQLGYMMLGLGLGGWLAGMFHLFTHAFFKSLLFLCSGSVIHACGTNEMPLMGGLRRKMPWTAGTMLVGCLAISGAGVPLLVGLSGYYSKDYIIAQALSFKMLNAPHAWLFWAAVFGAGLTAFYMFRLWYLTFAGPPRDQHVHDHAHESPWSMVVPLVILAIFSVVAGWNLWLGGRPFGLEPLLEQSRPVGIEEGASAGWGSTLVTHPPEHRYFEEPNEEIHVPATFWAFGAALGGFLLATAFYGLRVLDPEEARRQFAPLHRFLVHKWYFDELYAAVWVRPTLRLASWVGWLDRRGIDGVADGAARAVAAVARLDDWIDRLLVDGLIERIARGTHALGLRLRAVQTGNLRQYVMLIAVGTVALLVIVSLYWNWAG
jgi:NADH-quinone oxidoreductase subunit L